MNYKKGSSSTVIAIIVIIIVIGAVIFFNNKSRGEKLMVDGEAMMEEGENMMEEGEEMMEEGGAMMEEGEDMVSEHEGSAMEEESHVGEVLAGSTTPFLDFKQADYEKAKADGKDIMLYFYATWCPLCKVELADATEPAFDSLENENLIGFRVNYKDTSVDSAEKDLAREFQVAYQHTKVFLKGGEQVLKNGETWDTARYLEEINNIYN